MAAGGAGLADGADEVAAAGGVAEVCASAPDMRRGSAVNAPANKTRSVMRQDPTRGETRFMCASNDSLCTLRLPIHRRRQVHGIGAGFFAHYDACVTKAKAAPEGGL